MTPYTSQPLPKMQQQLEERIRGRHGFDMGRETFGACRGVEFLLNPATTVIVANDDNYALAA